MQNQTFRPIKFLKKLLIHPFLLLRYSFFKVSKSLKIILDCILIAFDAPELLKISFTDSILAQLSSSIETNAVIELRLLLENAIALSINMFFFYNISPTRFPKFWITKSINNRPAIEKLNLNLTNKSNQHFQLKLQRLTLPFSWLQQQELLFYTESF
jgi:hypothetical protein